MAVNRKFADSMKTRQFLSSLATVAPAVGVPNLVGQIPLVPLNIGTNPAGTAEFTGQLDGVFSVKVQAKDSSGTSGADANVAVAVGDILYLDDTPATALYYLSKRAGGVRWGYALEAITSGSNATIKVQVGY